MVIKNFDELINKVKKVPEKKRAVVVCAHDEHTLQAVIKAETDGLIHPILLGVETKIEEILKENKQDPKDYEIINIENDSEVAEKAVAMIRNKEAEFLIKGKIQTSDLLEIVVDRERGLRKPEGVLSHCAIYEIPNYHKLIFITDGGMGRFPNLEQKRMLLNNTVEALIKIGYDKPKVAALSAVEVVNPKIPETIDAEQLKLMSESGEIDNCIIEGPLSYDVAMSKESAITKGRDNPVSEDVDILLVPNITVGNVLGKALTYSAHAKMAGFILGAQVPIVLTSRGASIEEKYLSIVLSAAVV